MKLESTFTVPEAVSFEAAIALTQLLLEQMEQSEVSELEIEQGIGQLVQSENGARGFFVTYLAGDSALADQIHAPVLRGLHTSPALVASLLVRNLAMSTAMAIAHRRNQNEALAQGSDRVQQRAILLIQALQTPELQQQLQSLATSLETDGGDYQAFLHRWGYDEEQRQTIQQVLEQTNSICISFGAKGES
jgi:hypothetical protein